MDTQKYSVNQHLISNVMAWVKSGMIAIPEIQRPFVWDSSKVRDLMDSLYQGFPVGYIITWMNPSIRLKDGTTAQGKKILIDGQQRITALRAAILGEPIVDKDYKKKRIKISFHPLEEKFEVQTAVTEKIKEWIPDIAEIFRDGTSQYDFLNKYLAANPDIDRDAAVASITKLFNLANKQVGIIDLSPDIDIETVTEIFIRINSQGVVLSQADFAMSKIAANENYGGQTLRKSIDYFSNMIVNPAFYTLVIENDNKFTETDYFQKMRWLKDETEDLYDPKYTDVLRVAFTSKFNRGKLSDLVSLLSGRNFETREFEEEIAEASFEKLKLGIHDFMNETNFKRFIMIIKSAGFIEPKLIRSQNALNFAYIVYLKLKELGVNPADIESYVKKWYVYSVLTGRYSGSPESRFDFDIKQISEKPFAQYLKEKEDGELSDAFWNALLLQRLDTSVTSSPVFHVYLASCVKNNNRGFLSESIDIGTLLSYRGDVHHIFPKQYLKDAGMPRGQYNQIANYVYMQQEINIKVGKKAPHIYFGELLSQCESGNLKYGGISDVNSLKNNLKENCIPESVFTMTIDDYNEFLVERRKLMAAKMKDYYFSL